MDWGLLTADRPDGGGLTEDRDRNRILRWLVAAGRDRFAVAFVDGTEPRLESRPPGAGRRETSSSGR